MPTQKVIKGKPELGDTVRERVTGFEGVINSITRYVNGCERIAVQSAVLKDGLPADAQFFDIMEVDIIKRGKVKAEPVHDLRLPGGPRDIPPAIKRPK